MRRQQRRQGVRIRLAVAGGDGGQPTGAVVAKNAAQQQREDMLEERPVVVPMRHTGESSYSVITLLSEPVNAAALLQLSIQHSAAGLRSSS